jgi:D-alanyl-D-alanine dipeptidase
MSFFIPFLPSGAGQGLSPRTREPAAPQGQVLVFWECYRPHKVHVRMLEAVPNPDWVARPGWFARSHEAGR